MVPTSATTEGRAAAARPLIPKLIHHVWPGVDPFRQEFQRFRATFLQHHGDWNLFFWRTDLGAGTWDEVRTLLTDPNYTVVVKSDVARFEILRIHGGIYVDTDVECLRPFDPFLGDGFFCGRESDSVLCPSVVGCVPSHPLTELMVRTALARIRDAGPERANRTPNEICGPHLFTEVASSRKDVRVYDRGVFYPVAWWETNRLAEPADGAYAKHWWYGASPDGWTHKQTFGSHIDATSDPTRRIRYDLGGTVPRHGYVTVNVLPGSDVQCNILDLDTIHPADGEVDEFLIEHTLEHLPITGYVAFLKHLHRKLRVGGSVVVVQTDADAVIRRYARGELSFRSMRSTLFTPEDRVRGNSYQVHQNMWSAEELARDFRAVGFDARTFDAGSWQLDTHDPLYDDDVAPDRGKPILNLGVVATKR